MAINDKHFVTFHIQKDRRINLSYSVHNDRQCPALKGRDVQEISGPIVQAIPKCQHCLGRQTEQKHRDETRTAD